MAEKSMDAGGDIQFFELRMRLDTTININGQDWVKPGVETAVRLSDIPDADYLRTIAKAQQEANALVLDDLLVEINERLMRSRKDRG